MNTKPQHHYPSHDQKAGSATIGGTEYPLYRKRGDPPNYMPSGPSTTPSSLRFDSGIEVPTVETRGRAGGAHRIVHFRLPKLGALYVRLPLGIKD
ncbi:MAG TPA: hypothetical protein VET87_00480 [Rubrivivax sp.]|nr:hypothetical protein [Rubrivivax sp.]